MTLYRHFDLKKYITIKFEKGLLTKTIIIFTFAIICYYYNHLVLNIICLVIVIIYSIILNKDFLLSGEKLILNKLGINHKNSNKNI